MEAGAKRLQVVADFDYTLVSATWEAVPCCPVVVHDTV